MLLMRIRCSGAPPGRLTGLLHITIITRGPYHTVTIAPSELRLACSGQSRMFLATSSSRPTSTTSSAVQGNRGSLDVTVADTDQRPRQQLLARRPPRRVTVASLGPRVRGVIVVTQSNAARPQPWPAPHPVSHQTHTRGDCRCARMGSNDDCV